MTDGKEALQQSSAGGSTGLSMARWIWTAVFASVFIVRIAWPEMRDKIDEIALGILAIAALPWLGLFVTSFKAFGLEADLRDAVTKAEAASEKAEEASNLAQDTSQRLDLETAPDAVPSTADIGGTGGGAQTDALFELAQTYLSTRGSMASGNERTSEMTRIFREMMREARLIGPDIPQAVDGLMSDDPGRQLASTAYAYELPGQASPGDLINTISRSNQPFVQYWGLMALRKSLKIIGIESWNASDIAKFKALSGAFRERTDRHWVYQQILAGLGG